MRSAGLYVSVPFCRAKCTFCHFASEVFPPERMAAYVARLQREADALPALADSLGCELPRVADSIYLGGGTPSLLEPDQLSAVFAAIRARFAVSGDAEITMEAAPGQIGDALLERALREGVVRISLGVQSFVDREARAVGRLHTGVACRDEIARLRDAGVPRLSVDLIAGLPHHTEASWAESLLQAIDTGVEHVSVYMLETDGEQRLGGEVERVRALSQLAVLGQEARYSAAAVPADDAIADLYAQACETLESGGLRQYEISNFSRPGAESRHNCKYWQREPYVGLGLDAHSMLDGAGGGAVRFQNGRDLDAYLAADRPADVVRVDGEAMLEETVFLGLRMTNGVAVESLRALRQPALLQAVLQRAVELAGEGLMVATPERLRLTARGRVLSSSVFGELLTTAVA